MKKDIVFFDTNAIRNSWFNTLLWGIEQLRKFEKYADIKIPQIVYDEIIEQKRREFKSEKEKFLSSKVHSLISYNQKEIEEFDFENHIKNLKDISEINFEVITLENMKVMKDIQELALKKSPPFEKSDGTDKWFKDAVIKFTLEEFLKNNLDISQIYFCCKDWLLKESLWSNPKIKLVSSFDEYLISSKNAFLNPYLIKKISEYLFDNFDLSIKNLSDSITLISDSLDGEKIIEIDLLKWQNQWYDRMRIKIESGEIIASRDMEHLNRIIEMLKNSRAWKDTHIFAQALLEEDNYNWLTIDDCIALIDSAIINDQIYKTMHNKVEELFSIIFNLVEDHLTSETRWKMKEILSWKI